MTSAVESRPEIPLKKKILFALLTNAFLLTFLFAAGECFLRIRPVLNSDPDFWLVADEYRGFKLNPENEGINSLGIRHEELSMKQPTDPFRLLVVGDSVSFDRSSYVTMLRQHFEGDEIEIINAAIPGYTTYQERVFLERELVDLNPDLVLLQFCLNDNHRFLHELDESGRWLFHREAKDAMLPAGKGWINSLLRSSYLVTEIRIRLLGLMSPKSSAFPWNDKPDFASAWKDEPWEATRENLAAMKYRLSEISAGFAIVVIPYEPQLRQDLWKLDYEYSVKPQRKLNEIATELDVPLLNLHPAFVEASQFESLYRDGIHLNDRGHRVTTTELLRFLSDEELLPF